MEGRWQRNRPRAVPAGCVIEEGTLERVPMHKGGPAGVRAFRAFATRPLVIDGGAASSAVDPPHAEP